MSHFLMYAARMQDAGLCDLWVSLGEDKEGFRLMHVSPGQGADRELAARFPTRAFRLDGTDTKLQAIEDALIYGDGGVATERVKAAIEANPEYAVELADLSLSWAGADLSPGDMEITDAELADAAGQAEQMRAFVKGLMRGLDSVRSREASRAS